MKEKKGVGKQSYILTKETLGMTIMLFCFIVVIILLTGKIVFGGLGGAVCTFLYGTFGYASYIVAAVLAYLGEILVFERKIKINGKLALSVAAAAAVIFLLFHAVSTRNYTLEGYGSYLSSCYLNAANGYSGYSFGGVIAGLIVYPVAKVTTFIGAYVIFSLLLALCLYFVVLSSVRLYVGRRTESVPDEEAYAEKHEKTDDPLVSSEAERVDNLYSVNADYEIVDNRRYSAAQSAKTAQTAQTAQAQPAPEAKKDDDKFSQENLGRKILFEPGEFAAESYRRNMIYNDSSYFNHPVHNEGDYMQSFSDGKSKPAAGQNGGKSYTDGYSESVEKGTQGYSSPAYMYGDMPVESLGDPSSIRTQPYDSYTVNKPSENVYGEAADGKMADTDSAPLYDASDEENERADEPMRERADTPADGGNDNTPAPSAKESGTNPVSGTDERGSDRNSIFNIFNASNPRMDRGGVEPDVSAISGDRQNASRENLFSDNAGREASHDSGRDNLFGESASRETSRESGRDNLFGDNAGRETSRESGRDNLFGESTSRETSRESGRDNLFGDNTSREASRESSRENLFDEEGDDDSLFGISRGGLRGEEEQSRKDNPAPERRSDGLNLSSRDSGGRGGAGENLSRTAPAEIPPVREQPARTEAVAPKLAESESVPEPPKPHVWKKYVRPTLDLLDDYPENNNVNTGEIEDNKKTIVDTLANFRIASQVANVIVGPAITRYDVIIEDKTAIKSALKYRESIAMALMKENVTAYLNYSKGAISFEVPNTSRTVVGMKGLLASSQFINAKPNSLTFALGKNVEGQVVCPDITKMPHLLVAGTTGSGKSICLSALIVSLLYKYGPSELRFILVDPKQVEFISYDKLPHLMINEIIYDVDKAIKALNWAIKEMERRYQLFKEMTEKGVATKNLTEYNSHVQTEEEKLPKIVIILDEFGDLMLQAKKDIESRIIRLVQKARACGIHLILATQRPSVDCITGLIKSNLPTRIGFKVNSFDDARTIFDVGGAEKLLGKGDLYFRSAESPDLMRIQGCFIDTHEVQKVTDFVKANNETFFDQSVSDFINTVEEEETQSSGESAIDASETKIDDTFIKALSFCVTSNQASVSMIQRRFPIGYMKACKIIDWMENMNYITQSEGSKPRKVLLSREEFISKYGDVDD